MKLSVIIPMYNEEKTILEVLDKVSKAKTSVSKEIIVVDDGSTDNSKELVKNYIKKKKTNLPLKIFSKKNGGKGSAVKKGIQESTGDIVIIQDADMEYDPNEYQSLIQPIIDRKYKVIYGSRRLKKSNKKYSSFKFYLGGILVTWVTNVLFNSRLTDEPTCYKVFDANTLKGFEILSNSFEWEPEITAKILSKGIKIGEVPISYYPRKIEEGKKINWKDGVMAIYSLFYWRLKLTRS